MSVLTMTSAETKVIQNVIVCSLNDLPFAIPLEYVIQAIQRPTEITLIPRRDDAIDGTFVYREKIIPLVDLRRWLPWPGESQRLPQQVLLLQNENQWIGILIDAVEGLHKLGSDQILRLIHANDSQEIFHSSVKIPAQTIDQMGQHTNEQYRTLGLVDVPALLTLCQIWGGMREVGTQVSDISTETVAAIHVQTESFVQDHLLQHKTFASFAIGSRVIAIDTREVAAVLPMPLIQKILGSDASWLGMTKWRGRDVPVLAPLSSLGFAELNDEVNATELLVVLMHQGRCVALPVGGVRQVGQISSHQMQTPESAGFPNHPGLAGICHVDDGQQIFILNGAELIHSCPMSSLSEVEERDKKAHIRDRDIYVVVQAGHLWAINIRALESIIVPNEQIDRGAVLHEAQIGSFIWNQQTLALWDLGRLSTPTITEMDGESRVLIIRIGDQLIGLLVEKLILLLPGRIGQVHQFANSNARTSQLITVKHDDHIKSYSILDPENWAPLKESRQFLRQYISPIASS